MFDRFQFCATTCNRVCKRPQLVTSNNVGSCRPKMLRPFVRSLTPCWESLFDRLATSLNFTFKWLHVFDLDFYPTFPVTLAKPKIRSIGNRECAIISAVSMFGQKSRKNGRNIVGNCCVRLQKLKVWPISNFAQKLPTTCKSVRKRTPHVTSNNVASVCTGLNTSFLSSYPMLNVTWTKISGHLSKTFN